MLVKLLGKIKKTKKINCLLITPPLLDPKTIYIAMPVLLGQIKAFAPAGESYKAKNLDLNIKFFRKILSKDFIEKTKNQYDKQKIKYDEQEAEFIINNIQNSLQIYSEALYGNEEFDKAEDTINSALNFITLKYKNFKINKLSNFENSFLDFSPDYQYIQEITKNKEKNIFVEFFEEIIKKEIRKEKYDLIAITIPFIGALIPALTLSKLLKIRTKSHITIGGNYIKPQDIYNNPKILNNFCDSIMFGDGEESIIQLLKSIENRTPCKNVNGIMYKNKKNVIINTEPKRIKNINNLANMSFDGINFDEYLFKRANIYIINSKGCYWGKCTFCSLGSKYDKYQIKTPSKVIKDIKEIIQKYPQHGWIQFQDDALSPAYLNKLADEIIKENLNIYYTIFARFEKEFSDELIKKLYKSGLRSIYWGLESGCQSVLDKMNKGINLENVPHILKTCYETGISNMAGIIVNFPTETVEEINETIKFLKSVIQYVTISPGQYALMKNSYVYKNCEKYGLKITKENDFSYAVEFKDTNLSNEIKQKKWSDFLEVIKTTNYKIDENKSL